MILTILYFLLALGVLVTIHEFGHFYVARRCGVKVIRFSVGFGTPLATWKDRLGTEYTLAAIPLGGYVKMLDEREGEVAPNELSSAFSQKTVWQRMAIVVAGPLANFILAILLYFVIALSGSQGVVPVTGDLPAEGIAAQAGLRAGDEIIAVDGDPVMTWNNVFSRLLHRMGDSGYIELSVQAFNSAPQVKIDEIISASTTGRIVRLPINRWLHDNEAPDLFQELGIVQFMPDAETVINQVVSNSAADFSGLQSGDKVLLADGVEVKYWQDWVSYVRARPDVLIDLLIQRGDEQINIALTPRRVTQDKEGDIGQAGVSTSLSWPDNMVRDIHYSPLGAFAEGLRRTVEQAGFILSFIKKLIVADVSTKNLSGTFTIAQAAGDSAKAGVLFYLAFIAYLSVSLGVFNLLPIPVLDGGHLLYYVVELIKGSPVSEKIQLIGYQIGLACILSIMVLAHVNDLRRIFF
ncbi:MAG: regulator of sigma E protease [Candidatus Endobugula sp.]|jgi:regulator of sigma E protease